MTGSPLSSADFELLLQGAGATLRLFAGAFIISLVLGTIMGVIRSGEGNRITAPIRAVLAGYSSIFRGIPILVQMLFLFYGLSLIGVHLDRFLAASIALSAFGAAAFSEIVRASIDSIPSGQTHAGLALGLSFYQILRYVVAPQAVRIATPPTVGFAALTMKATALASVLGFIDLVRAGSIISIRTRNPIVAYSLVGLAYIILVLPLLIVSRRIEARTQHLQEQEG